MPNLSISQLPDPQPASDSDLIPVVQVVGVPGQPVKMTRGEFLTGTGSLVGVPATSLSPGSPGQFAYDQEWFYLYVGDGGLSHLWMRVGIAIWD